jgi:hypothetical protein
MNSRTVKYILRLRHGHCEVILQRLWGVSEAPKTALTQEERYRLQQERERISLIIQQMEMRITQAASARAKLVDRPPAGQGLLNELRAKLLGGAA